MKYVVLGGAGSMGKITVTDLVHTCSPSDTVVIADFDEKKAKDLAATFGSLRGKGPTVQGVFANARDQAQLVSVLQGADVVVNAAQYQLNLDVMRAALQAHCHYVDLGGLFHVTRKQLELDEEFKKIGKTALLGMGAAPGITNILAKHAADQMDKVQEIHCRVGSMDKTRYEPKPALAVSYSLKTILEEFSFEPAVFTKGEFKFVKPMSGDQPHQFPSPVGIQRPMYTIHSEVATLPVTYQAKGVKEVSFKIAFDPEFLRYVRFLRDLGMASHDPMSVEGCTVKPIDVVNKVAMNQPVAKQVGKLKQYEVVRSVVKGTQGKKKVCWIVDCHTAGMPEWGVGLDIDTGSPPAIGAQMLAKGLVVTKGAVPPEAAVPAKEFFAELKRRKMKVSVKKMSGWSYRV